VEPNTALVVCVGLVTSLLTVIAALRLKRVVKAEVKTRFLTLSLEAGGDVERPLIRDESALQSPTPVPNGDGDRYRPQLPDVRDDIGPLPPEADHVNRLEHR